MASGTLMGWPAAGPVALKSDSLISQPFDELV